MIISEKLLAVLRCPDSGQKLEVAPAEVVASLNERITSGGACNRGGATVTKPVAAGLLREDGDLLYPVDDGFPILLVDEAIPV